ncbi:hypothetical protein FHG87_004633 [Trinorchestia longiramus]|nr:hypothetical protein FHG87_004633 [Trinorchestia longiramus]
MKPGHSIEGVIEQKEASTEGIVVQTAFKGIVRNKAAENAKHIIPGTHSPVSQATSVISHAAPTGHDTALQRTGSYSINGILGIPQPHTDPNGNINKRKREDSDEHRELNGHSEEDLKRQRTQYTTDPLYTNMLWSKQWTTLKTDDNSKALLPDLGTGVPGAVSPYSAVQSFVDHSGGFPPSVAVSGATDALYDSMAMTNPASNHVYTPPLATSLGAVPGLAPLAPISMQDVKPVLSSPPQLDSAASAHTHYQQASPTNTFSFVQPPSNATSQGSMDAPFSPLPHFSGTASVGAAMTDYSAYSSPYSQAYATGYPTYGYGSSGLLSLGNYARQGGVNSSGNANMSACNSPTEVPDASCNSNHMQSSVQQLRLNNIQNPQQGGAPDSR